MSQLIIKANDNVVSYLTSFRGYKFQVSRTEDGDCDLGSSPVMFMKEFKGFPCSYLKEHLRGQVGLALNSHWKIMNHKTPLAHMCKFYSNNEL